MPTSEGVQHKVEVSLMDHRISRTIRFIEMNYSTNISLDDLANCAGVSRSRLFLLFRVQTGLSPVRYLMQTRIRKAAELLGSDGVLSVKQVMAQVGLTSKSHFARSFKQVFGVTPSRYRTGTFSEAP